MFWQKHKTDTPAANSSPVSVQKKTVANGELLTGQWVYLPGSFRENNGITIKPAQFSIVEQDGSNGQPSPAINAYGTHLEGVSDIAITARMQNLHNPASVQLYGQLPVVADEFRVEHKSIKATIDGNKLTISLWDGSGQTPVITREADITGNAAADRTLTITCQKGTLQFAVDGQTLIDIADSKVFGDGNIWFGFDASITEWFLASLTAEGLNGKTFQNVDSSTVAITAPATDGLQQLVVKKRPDFTIGAAMAIGPAVSDPSYAQVAFGGQFGALTPENAMKWQFTEPVRGLYTFQEGDALVALAQRNNMKVQGHTLVFGEANPAWVRQLPPDQLERAMVDHIKIVVGHYKGKVATWDVVNEPFDDDEWDQLRPHLWYQSMGDSYIAKAFTAAHDADPDALLFMNEYGLEEDGSRWDNFLALVAKLKEQGVPIHGVGFQAHVYEAGDKINPDVLRKHFQQLASIGVKARVSEMDVYIEDGTAVQAQQYGDILNACLSEPNCISWTTWGVTDKYNYFKDDDGSIQTGDDFLWNQRLQATPAVKRMQDLLR
jgi:endo-1,4-beta-xylanase